MRISDWSSDVCSSDLRVGHGDDRGGQGQVVRVAQHVGDEAAVDLDAVDGYPAQVAQAGEAGAEVVQPDLDPGAAQAPEQGAGADLVADHRGLGELDVQALWHQACVGQRLCDLFGQVAVAQIDRKSVG